MFQLPQAFKRSGRKSSRKSHRAPRSLFSFADALESRLLLAAATPTDYEQYMLEFINRARANPDAEAARYGITLNEGVAAGTITSTAKQPLAFNVFLIDAARGHSQDMIDRDYFTHNTLVTGETPDVRMTNSGYVFNGAFSNGWGENLGQVGETPSIPDPTTTTADIHQGLFVDSTVPGRGHRINIEVDAFKEVGVGIVAGVFTNGGTDFNTEMATIDFAYNDDGTNFLTGVAYHDDVVTDQFYEPGEGLGGATITAVNTLNNNTFSTTAFSSGGYTLALPAGTYTVTASGGGLASPIVASNVVMGALNLKVDFIKAPPPTVAIDQAAAQADPTNATAINYTAVFSAPVTGFSGTGVTLAGTAGATTAVVTGSGTTYNIAVSGMTHAGTVIVTLPPGAALAAGGTASLASTSTDNTITFDNVAPNVTINQAAAQPGLTGASPINFTVVFDKTVTGFTGANVTLDGTAGATTAVVTGSGTTYNVAVSGMVGPGTVIASIAAGAVFDLAGNGNAASTSIDNSVDFDNVVPTVSIDQAAGQVDPTNASPVNITVVFSKPVTGFTNSDITLSGTAGATTAVVSGSGTTYNVAVSGMTGAGTVIASILAGVAADAAGNGNAASTSTDNAVAFDAQKPGVTVNQAVGQADPTAIASVAFRVVFSKPVFGFTGSNVVIGGTAGATTALVTGSGTTYTVTVTGMMQSGSVILTVPADAAADGLGNTNIASTSTDNTVTFDITPPSVTIDQAAAQADPTNAGTINYTVVFSEPVTGFTGADVLRTGTAGATTAIVTGGPATYNVAVRGMIQNGTVIVNIPSSAAADLAGNASLASTSTDNTVTYDTVRPNVTVNQAATQADPTSGAEIHFTVVFSEPVAAFTGNNVRIGGTAGATTATVVSGDGTTFDIMLTGMTQSGTVTARIQANRVTDLAGNFNNASTTIDNTVFFNNVPPTVTIDQVAAQADPTNVSPINFTVVFDNPVTGFDASGVVIGGTYTGPSTVVVTGSGAVYNVAVSGLNGAGTLIATIPADVATDTAGNGNDPSTSTDNSVTFDNVSPAVTVGPAFGQGASTHALTVNFAVAFAKPVTGFTSSDVVIGGTAGATTAVVTGNGANYNVAVSGMVQDGTIILTVPAGVAADVVGNLNTASTGANNVITYDTVSPMVFLNRAAGQNDPTNADTIHFTAVFSEPVGGFVGDDMVLSGTAGATTAVVTGMGTTYDVAVSGMTRNGTIIANIPGFAATDAAGNPSFASLSIGNIVTYDTVAPTVTINKAAGQIEPTETAPINFTVVFSEPVTGFTGTDLVLGGTAGATSAVVTDSGTTYNVALSGMSRNGTVIPSIPAWVASDAAGNGNAPSTSTDNSVAFADLPPTVTVRPAAGQADPVNAGAVNFTVVFSKPVTGFGAEDVVIIGGSGMTVARVTGGGTTYNVAVSGIHQTGPITIAIPPRGAIDAAGTGNAASATSAPVMFDIRPPTATLKATKITRATSGKYAFSVIYKDKVAVNAATIGNGDLIVTGPDGIDYDVAAKWVQPASPLVNGLSVTGSYTITPPRGGWDAAHNGVYTVVLQYRQIADVAGNRIATSKTGLAIGTIRVNITDSGRTARSLAKPVPTRAAALPSSQPSLFASGSKRIGTDVWD